MTTKFIESLGIAYEHFHKKNIINNYDKNKIKYLLHLHIETSEFRKVECRKIFIGSRKEKKEGIFANLFLETFSFLDIMVWGFVQSILHHNLIQSCPIKVKLTEQFRFIEIFKFNKFKNHLHKFQSRSYGLIPSFDKFDPKSSGQTQSLFSSTIFDESYFLVILL